MRKFLRNRLHTNANKMLSQANLIKNMYLNSIKSDISNYYKNFISKTAWNSEVHNLIRQTTAYKKRQHCKNEILQTENENVISGTFEANQAFAINFIKNHTIGEKQITSKNLAVKTNYTTIENAISDILFGNNLTARIQSEEQLENTNNLLPNCQRGVLTCTEEVAKVIKRKINKRSSGIDNMPITLIKHFSIEILDIITTFFNHLLAIQIFPQNWKFATITPIPKAGKDRTHVKNWRPISNLNTLSKIFEKIIDHRLSSPIRI